MSLGTRSIDRGGQVADVAFQAFSRLKPRSIGLDMGSLKVVD